MRHGAEDGRYLFNLRPRREPKWQMSGGYRCFAASPAFDEHIYPS